MTNLNQDLAGKNILIGVTGGIAAYKIPDFVRQCIKRGAAVKVIMTEASRFFVTEETLAVVSKNPVYHSFFDNEKQWNSHVELGLWADVFVVAPATANTLAKMRTAQADNLLLATYLSAKCLVMVSPAMDLDMWKHPAVQQNVTFLKDNGVKVIEPASGELASGLVGEGRMPEPEELVDELISFFSKKKILTGRKVVINAGPTREAIDPVRYISNQSSGKMGVSLATEAYNMGAEVYLIMGPTNLTLPTTIHTIPVTTADEMYQESVKQFQDADVFIGAAAVADYRVAEVASQKIKKQDERFTIELVKNKDILMDLGKQKMHQILVGFALETNNEEESAKGKLKKKNLDLIVLNSLNDKEAGFAKNTNKITIFDSNGKQTAYEAKDKKEVARDILEYISYNKLNEI